MAKDNKDGLGLDSLGNLSSLLKNEEDTGNGKPLDLDVSLIDEDPEQPRNIFIKSTLKELAASIEERGVKSPISVRIIDGGRYMINHGARRFRASLLAGKKTIPAYIDTDYSKADQVIENLHRDNLTSREIAEFIGRQIAEGKKKGQVAKEIGKSGAFVTQHYTLLSLPEELDELYNSGKCNDITVLYEFAVAYKKHKNEVIGWINSNKGEWNRTNVKLFKEYLETQEPGVGQGPEQEKTQEPDQGETQELVVNQGPEQEETQEPDQGETQELVVNQGPEQEETQEPDQGETQELVVNQGPEQEETQESGVDSMPEPLENGVIIIEYEGIRGKLLIDKWPTQDGYCWAEFETETIEINMKNAKFVSLIEG